MTATRPRPRPAAKAAARADGVTVNPADPRFNAAVEEWRAAHA